MKYLVTLFIFSFCTGHCFSRVRDLGIPLPGTTGKLNSLGENSTDPRQWELLEAKADQRRVVKA